MTDPKPDPNSWNRFFLCQVYLFLTLTPFFMLMIRCWPDQTEVSWSRVLLVSSLSSSMGFCLGFIHRVVSGRVDSLGFFYYLPAIGNHQIVHFDWSQIWLSKATVLGMFGLFVLVCDLTQNWWQRRKLRAKPLAPNSLLDDTF